MDTSALNSLSPLDGRYFEKTKILRDYFSEGALISYRIRIEVLYLIALSDVKIIRSLKPKEKKFLLSLLPATCYLLQKIKDFESTTHHDVKAVEYFLREQLETTSLKDLIPFIHFGLTSEDVNNLAYRLMVKSAHEQVLLPIFYNVLSTLAEFSSSSSAIPLLARTHGQPAISTTLGKELSVFLARLLTQVKKMGEIKLTGKLNGAVGSYHSFAFASPKTDWLKFSELFTKNLGLTPNFYTTQINPPDDLIDLFHTYHHLNSILIDLNQDLWRYISDDWLIQKKEANVGSSTMPQKINPIEFENSEGNLIMANGLFETFSRKLPISRLQRDLSDSTVMRNIGVAFGHCLLAYQSLLKGLATISPNTEKIYTDLNANWNILSEPLQIYFRSIGNPEAYEQVATKMKGKVISQKDWQELTKGLNPKIQKLTPSTYLGYSIRLTKKVAIEVNTYLNKHK